MKKLLFLVLLFTTAKAYGYRFSWTGLAGDSLFITPANWTRTGVPNGNGGANLYPMGGDTVYFSNGNDIGLKSPNSLTVGFYSQSNSSDGAGYIAEMYISNNTILHLVPVNGNARSLTVWNRYGTLHMDHGELYINDGNLAIAQPATQPLTASISYSMIHLLDNAAAISLNGNVAIDHSTLICPYAINSGGINGTAPVQISIDNSILRSEGFGSGSLTPAYTLSLTNSEIQLGAYSTSSYPSLSIGPFVNTVNCLIRLPDVPTSCTNNRTSTLFFNTAKPWNGDVISEITSQEAVLNFNCPQNDTVRLNGSIRMAAGNFAMNSANTSLQLTGDFINSGSAAFPATFTCNPNVRAGFFQSITVGTSQVFTTYKSKVSAQAYSLIFTGSSDSHIQWPTALWLDTLVIAKSGSGRVIGDTTPIYVRGRLSARSGELDLYGHDQTPFQMVVKGRLNVDADARIYLLPDATGHTAHVAIGL